MIRTPEMQKVVDGMSQTMFGRKQSECVDVCVACGKAVGEFRNEISRIEYGISRMCQKCQDSVFGED